MIAALITMNVVLWGAGSVYRNRLAPALTRASETQLRHELRVMRKMIDQYTADQQRAPQSLRDLVDRGYLVEVPTDPMTGSNATWTTILEENPLSLSGGRGIVDVKSGSDAIDVTRGRRYSDW